MRYLRIIAEGTGEGGSYGIIKGNRVHLLTAAPFEGDVRETGCCVDLNDIEVFLPPVEPPNIIALGLNYREHAAESRMELPDEPVIFFKATTAITGHMQPVVLPVHASGEVDYEAELAVVIGRKCKSVTEAQAADCIFGYTCSNDVSARDCQLKKDKQWARGKSFDTFAPTGPWIETCLDPLSLRIQSRLNGRVMQDASTADMLFNPFRLVSYISRQMTLLPGTLILTGTPSGVGFARNPQVFLKAGDEVSVIIEGVGALHNKIAEEKV